MTRNACAKFEWMVGPLVDGELEAAQVERVEGHFRECPSCRGLAEDFRAFDRLARQRGAPPPVSAAEWDRVWEGIAKEPGVSPVILTGRLRVLDWILPVLSLAALALLGALVAVSVVGVGPRMDEKNINVIQGPEEPRGAPAIPPPAQPQPRKKGESR